MSKATKPKLGFRELCSPFDAMGSCDGPIFVDKSRPAFVEERYAAPLTKGYLWRVRETRSTTRLFFAFECLKFVKKNCNIKVHLILPKEK